MICNSKSICYMNWIGIVQKDKIECLADTIEYMVYKKGDPCKLNAVILLLELNILMFVVTKLAISVICHASNVFINMFAFFFRCWHCLNMNRCHNIQLVNMK